MTIDEKRALWEAEENAAESKSENSLLRDKVTDEEIAIAQCLVKMDNYVKTGVDFYSLSSAMTDAKTALL